ncbi:uncharacterized protein TRIADDRAFT_56084 [Trichoplax adhaerens]|uniref:Gustatory receptor n=1 Tax=Trichoplax adhaerens TaxID=10228 RepID=B3RTY0_TRIAD|nr:hypothetical protein TRIADDRAFT_56084 [Trichoplax adhaerens]EDV25705.1 hypothetical protein TRIADDRAFT_56084 [Trichoplax adhaerens]|eukprot:XP_002111738.1 hypothetical protein TRIADDRAFT_56084 [Trichoplax adhaerens]
MPMNEHEDQIQITSRQSSSTSRNAFITNEYDDIMNGNSLDNDETVIVSHNSASGYIGGYPTSIALDRCKRHVLAPYLRFISFLGWLPIFRVGPSNQSFCESAINFVYPVLVICFIFGAYTIQCFTCFRRDTPFIKTINGSVHCSDSIISQYIIPDILHSVAYFYCFYLYRFAGSEHLQTNMQRTFLQARPTDFGENSQKKLIRILRVFLYSGIAIVGASFLIQLFHLIIRINRDQGLALLWHPMIKIHDSRLIVLGFFLLAGFIMLDSVYIALVINYASHCQLLIVYIRGLKQKIIERTCNLENAMKEIQNTAGYVAELNDVIAPAASIILFNFATSSILGLNALILGRQDDFDVATYADTILSILLWLTLLSIPFVQASRLTSYCRSLKKLGIRVRVRPFVYQNEPREDLDSFLQFTSEIKMRAKLFKVPVVSSTLFFMLVTIALVALILFQLGILSIWFAPQN